MLIECLNMESRHEIRTPMCCLVSKEPQAMILKTMYIDVKIVELYLSIVRVTLA